MPEPGNSEVHRKIPRRIFFTTGLKALLGAGVGVKIAQEISHEQHLAETGEFETATAIWRPIYETHPQHETVIRAAKLRDLSALSFETIVSFSATPIQLLTGYSDGQDTIPSTKYQLIPSDVLFKLQTSQTNLLFGDVDTSKTNANLYTLNIMRSIMGIVTPLAIMRAGAAIESRLPPSKLTRRLFVLKTILTGILAGGAMVLPPSLRKDVVIASTEAFERKAANQRILARLSTLNTNLMPEDLRHVFRELVQANKLLVYADIMKEFGQSRKPKIGFNWHFGHGGIEDWLRMDRATLRACILAFPNDVLSSIIRENGDARCLHGLRVVRVPRSLKVVDRPDNKRDVTMDRGGEVFDDIFEDRELKQAFINRGLVEDRGYLMK